MKLILNGTAQEWPDDLTAHRLIERLGLQGKRLAIEVNQEILPRSRFAEHRFHDGDRVEIVHAIGGG